MHLQESSIAPRSTGRPTMQNAMSTSLLQKPFAGTTVLGTRAGLMASPRRQNRRSALVAVAQDKQQVRKDMTHTSVGKADQLRWKSQGLR